MTAHLSSCEAALADLDAELFAQEDDKWQGFYANRDRPCPFFALVPDENLCGWLSEGQVPVGKALDLGCGNGRNAIFMSKQGFDVEGVDYSMSAVAWAKDEIARAGLSLPIHCMSVFGFPLQPCSYDFVYDSGCFHHIAPHRRRQYVRRAAAALKPGGVFGLVCFTPEGGSGYSDEEVYERSSMGGGLGYSEARLRKIWSESLHVDSVRRMVDQGSDSGMFGKSYLWVLFARKR
jgi:SAM-dependent methyltransferase